MCVCVCEGGYISVWRCVRVQVRQSALMSSRVIDRAEYPSHRHSPRRECLNSPPSSLPPTFSDACRRTMGDGGSARSGYGSGSALDPPAVVVEGDAECAAVVSFDVRLLYRLVRPSGTEPEVPDAGLPGRSDGAGGRRSALETQNPHFQTTPP